MFPDKHFIFRLDVYFSFYEASSMSYIEDIIRESDLRLQNLGNIGEISGRIRGTVAYLGGEKD
jgi:hypothetical protein